ncbi:hypothetical protein MmTuc01_1699 [Methanosarcina mazei Tuc01]|uniref:Uncharacterized protein n=1 Tax=Methanosarcina mazei Tuc01 TaxID=1236903 RepID=M1PXP3_METMZ|nr:hypothetical protein MmTuc01_1699 [Methanosarcina mazei Tuc01]
MKKINLRKIPVEIKGFLKIKSQTMELKKDCSPNRTYIFYTELA